MAALSAGAAEVAPGLVRPEVLAERACSWLVAHGLPLIGAIPGTHSAREGIYVALIDADAELGGTFPRGILHRRKGSISSGKRNRPKPLWRALPAHSSSCHHMAVPVHHRRMGHGAERRSLAASLPIALTVRVPRRQGSRARPVAPQLASPAPRHRHSKRTARRVPISTQLDGVPGTALGQDPGHAIGTSSVSAVRPAADSESLKHAICDTVARTSVIPLPEQLKLERRERPSRSLS